MDWVILAVIAAANVYMVIGLFTRLDRIYASAVRSADLLEKLLAVSGGASAPAATPEKED